MTFFFFSSLFNYAWTVPGFSFTLRSGVNPRTGRPLASVFSTCDNSIRKLQREITILCRVQISDSRRRAIHPGSPRAIFSLRGRKLKNCLVFIIFCDWSRARITPVNLLLYYLRIRLIRNKTDGQIGPPSVLSELLLYADINDESFQCFPFFSPQGFCRPLVWEKLGAFKARH